MKYDGEQMKRLQASGYEVIKCDSEEDMCQLRKQYRQDGYSYRSCRQPIGNYQFNYFLLVKKVNRPKINGPLLSIKNWLNNRNIAYTIYLKDNNYYLSSNKVEIKCILNNRPNIMFVTNKLNNNKQVYTSQKQLISSCLSKIYNDSTIKPQYDTREEFLKDRLMKYFCIGSDNCTAYNLTRVKEAKNYGTLSIDDFVEFDEEVINDIVDFVFKEEL